MDGIEGTFFDDNLDEWQDMWMEITNLESSSSSSSSSDSEGYGVVEQLNAKTVSDLTATIDVFNDVQLKHHMRLKKDTIAFLIERFKTSEFFPKPHSGGKCVLGAKKCVHIYVWYVSNTVTYRQLSILFGIAKSMAWNAVKRVAQFLISCGPEFLKWPLPSEIPTIASKFERKRGIGSVIGAIDCTHIKIRAPVVSKESYYDRKQDYRIVLQAVVDAEKRFLSITCGEPGSLHDSRVLSRSDLFRRAQENREDLFPGDTFLLGDSAYAPSSWLVPPFKDHDALTDLQKRFNYIHSSTRIVVENAFGLLKTRFRRLMHFTEQSDLKNVANIVVSICILHNICLMRSDVHEADTDVVPEENEQENLMYDQSHGPTRRDILIADLQSKNLL